MIPVREHAPRNSRRSRYKSRSPFLQVGGLLVRLTPIEIEKIIHDHNYFLFHLSFASFCTKVSTFGFAGRSRLGVAHATPVIFNIILTPNRTHLNTINKYPDIR